MARYRRTTPGHELMGVHPVADEGFAWAWTCECGTTSEAYLTDDEAFLGQRVHAFAAIRAAAATA